VYSRHPILALVGLIACERPQPSSEGSALVGAKALLVSEASAEYDSAAFEIVSSEATIRDSGFGNDPDTAVRRVWDPAARRWRYFTLARRTGRIVEKSRTGKVAEWSAAAEGDQPSAVNPLDLALDSSGRLWVSRGGSSQLLVLGRDNTARVDLSRFSATVSCTRPGRSCGNPSMSAVTFWGGAIHVALRRLRDGFDVETDALIVRVDPATMVATAFVTLEGLRNPGERFSLVAGPENPGRTLETIGGPLSNPPEKSSALVRLDLSTGAWSKLVDGRAENAFVVSHTLDNDGGFAILAEYDTDRLNPTRLVRFSSDGRVMREILRTSGYNLWRVGSLDAGRLLVSERSSLRYGIRVLRLDGVEIGSVRTLLPPYDFEVYSDE